jgi:hypothetical protein
MREALPGNVLAFSVLRFAALSPHRSFNSISLSLPICVHSFVCIGVFARPQWHIRFTSRMVQQQQQQQQQQ